MDLESLLLHTFQNTLDEFHLLNRLKLDKLERNGIKRLVIVTVDLILWSNLSSTSFVGEGGGEREEIRRT